MAGGHTTLQYFLHDVEDADFRDRWKNIIPWFADLCEPGTAHLTLRLKESLKGDDAVAEFCDTYLIHHLHYRDVPLWYDDRADLGTPTMPRLAACVAALFILSNHCRYEPEPLDAASREPSDVAYFLDTFLDSAERYIPQMLLDFVYGNKTFFV